MAQGVDVTDFQDQEVVLRQGGVGSEDVEAVSAAEENDTTALNDPNAEYHIIRARVNHTKTKGSPFESCYDVDALTTIECSYRGRDYIWGWDVVERQHRKKMVMQECLRSHQCCFIAKESGGGNEKASCKIPDCGWVSVSVDRTEKELEKWKKAYKDHAARHLRPFLCDVETCKYSVAGFVTNAALARHKKCGEHPMLPGAKGENPSVDSTEEFLCEVAGCRQTRDIKGRGFSRYDNLVAHLRSVHDEKIDKRRGNLPKRLRRPVKRVADEMDSEEVGNVENGMFSVSWVRSLEESNAV
ncbi:hypothetical protein BJ508DRAFT_136315 [Ascobolus immersus RN42]|uniref:C2H2-type domain-containing protein n=1 Tax=Ascobolus immersus RN42 TaxID=1160509 RepID=A0A3N4ILR8_ASCIM|nr:hypothetical protein BJ508DRAFT_136315 [Ascobolus immersus RN42]